MKTLQNISYIVNHVKYLIECDLVVINAGYLELEILPDVLVARLTERLLYYIRFAP